MKNSHRLLKCVVGIVCCLMITSQVFAEAVGMVTGSATGTYITFGHDIAGVAKQLGLTILVKESEGSIENIERLVSKENAAFAIVQSDVLGYLARSEEANIREIAQKLRLISPFYNEEVHLLANKQIQRFEDLQGKRVAVGTQGSGTWLTTKNLFDLTGVEPAERLYLSPVDAVEAVLLGEADAMFYVVGKPGKQFTNLEAVKAQYPELIENVHFVPLDDPRMLQQEYVRSEIGSHEYAWCEQTVPTIAVKAVLISFDFSSKQTAYYRQRCQQLATLGRAIRENLPQLRQTGHPKWQEVNLEEELGIWERDACSRPESPPASGPTRLRDLLQSGGK